MIDLASQYAVKFDYWENGRLAESFFLFSPDDEIKEKVKAEYENHGFTQEILHLVRQDETELSYIQADYKKHSIHAALDFDTAALPRSPTGKRPDSMFLFHSCAEIKTYRTLLQDIRFAPVLEDKTIN